jgi:hypothetical protein
MTLPMFLGFDKLLQRNLCQKILIWPCFILEGPICLRYAGHTSQMKTCETNRVACTTEDLDHFH